MSRPKATLTIEGETHAVRKATFGLHISGEVWDARSKTFRYDPRQTDVTYGLEVEVDGRSGEDGAPAPEIQNLPVLRAAGGRHPSLARLGDLVVQELDDGYDCDEWDAWFGNDAPGLCGNRVVFQGWEGNALRVRWEAHYDEGGRSRPFLFEGLVDFTGIYVRVKEAEDADVFLAGAWGAQDPGTLDKHVLGWSDHGPDLPADRRFHFAAIYTRKGEPLPEGYRVGALTKAAATAEREARQARFDAAAAARKVTPTPPAPAASPNPGPARRLFEGRKRFSLEAPADWAEVSAEDQAIARLGGISLRRGVHAGEENLKILAVEMSIADDIAEYADTSIGAYASIWKVEQRAEVDLSGARAQRLVIEQRIGDATTRLLKYFIALPGKSVAVMTFGAPASVFDSRLDAYEAIARTLVVAR